MARTKGVSKRDTVSPEPQQQEERISNDGWGRSDAADSSSRVDGGFNSHAACFRDEEHTARRVDYSSSRSNAAPSRSNRMENNRSDSRGSRNHSNNHRHGEFRGYDGRRYDHRRHDDRRYDDRRYDDRYDHRDRNHGNYQHYHQPHHIGKYNRGNHYRHDNRRDYRDRDNGRRDSRYERGGRSSHRQPRTPDHSHSRSSHNHPPPKRIKNDPSIDRLKAQKEKNSLELEVIEQKIKIEESKRKLEAVQNQSAAPDDVRMGTASITAAGAATAALDTNRSIPAAAARAPFEDDELFSDTSVVEPTGPSFANTEDDQHNTDATKKKAAPKANRTLRENTNQSVAPAMEELVDSDDEHEAKSGTQPKKKGNATPYTEKNLMKVYKPTIIDHSLVTKKCLVTSKLQVSNLLASKILVQWNETDGSIFGSKCRSWISIQDCVFPSTVKSYISKLIKDGRHKSDRDTLKKIREMVEKIEQEEKWNNVIQDLNVDEEDEGSDLEEIDFCCFVCKCVRDDNDVLRSTTRNCVSTRKHHRACCHGYTDLNDLDGFVSVAGRAFESALCSDETSDEAPATTAATAGETTVSGEIKRAVTVFPSEGLLELNDFQDIVMLSISTGIGSVSVALKEMGLRVKRIIYVEDDPVAQHVIRYRHDPSYGDGSLDDGIEHVVGLYESLDDIYKDPKELVKKFGPIDLIICSSIGENEFQHKQYTERFFTLCQNVKKVNKVIDERHESLLYLIETYPGSAKGSTIDSICLCDSRFGDKSTRAFICNWPLNKERASLENLGNSLPSTKANTLDNVLGLPEDYAFPPVEALFKELKTAFTVGCLGKRWSKNVHPKYWNFLALGPNGHGFEVKRRSANDSPLDALQIKIRNSASSALLCDVDYSTKLLNESMSARWLKAIMKPLLGDRGNTTENDQVIATEQYHDALSRNQLIDMDASEESENVSNSQVQHQGRNGDTESQNAPVKLEDQSKSNVKVDENEVSTDEEQMDAFNDIQPLVFDL